VYAVNEAEPVHGRARQLVQSLAEGPELAYLFWPTVMGFLRVVTHPAILPQPLAPIEAAANIAQLLARPHILTAGEGEGFWKLYRATAGDQARGNDVPDGHLVALMRQNGVRVIYTRDRGFRRFPDIEVRDPFT
jgi:toxin-antitoxin system PIN domain toxin